MSNFLEKPLELKKFNQKKEKTYGFYKFFYKKTLFNLPKKYSILSKISTNYTNKNAKT